MANNPKTDAANKLIGCAKQEFLEKGYEGASLRQIAKRAGVSTYLIYDRFTDKAGLLEAVVAPARDGLVDAYAREMQLFNDNMPNAPYDEMRRYSIKSCGRIVDVIYDDLDSFRLMMRCPAQTGYDEMLHRLVEIHVRQTLVYLAATGQHMTDEISDELQHIIINSMFSGLFETVRHEMDRESAAVYYRQFLKYHMTGFKAFCE